MLLFTVSVFNAVMVTGCWFFHRKCHHTRDIIFCVMIQHVCLFVSRDWQSRLCTGEGRADVLADVSLHKVKPDSYRFMCVNMHLLQPGMQICNFTVI